MRSELNKKLRKPPAAPNRLRHRTSRISSDFVRLWVLVAVGRVQAAAGLVKIGRVLGDLAIVEHQPAFGVPSDILIVSHQNDGDSAGVV